jgi:GMP synthase-like glutamine amidotransferase
MTRVLVYQHHPTDGPGFIGQAMLRQGAELDVCRLDQGQAVRDASAHDVLLVMGGKMNVYQEDRFPWLAEETRVIRLAALAGKAVLGICLGGQLLAKALGARVHLGGAREIALAEIALTKAGRDDPLFGGLPSLEAVVWHDDTFDIPEGAIGLAESAGCANQAFRYGERAYGLQFHPEVTPAMLADWMDGASDLLDENKQALRDQFARKADGLQAQADCLAANFLRHISI